MGVAAPRLPPVCAGIRRPPKGSAGGAGRLYPRVPAAWAGGPCTVGGQEDPGRNRWPARPPARPASPFARRRRLRIPRAAAACCTGWRMADDSAPEQLQEIAAPPVQPLSQDARQSPAQGWRRNPEQPQEQARAARRVTRPSSTLLRHRRRIPRAAPSSGRPGVGVGNAWPAMKERSHSLREGRPVGVAGVNSASVRKGVVDVIPGMR